MKARSTRTVSVPEAGYTGLRLSEFVMESWRRFAQFADIGGFLVSVLLIACILATICARLSSHIAVPSFITNTHI